MPLVFCIYLSFCKATNHENFVFFFLRPIEIERRLLVGDGGFFWTLAIVFDECMRPLECLRSVLSSLPSVRLLINTDVHLLCHVLDQFFADHVLNI